MDKHISEHYPTSETVTDTQAQAARNKRAKELRALGYIVECKKWDFTDLARCRDYTLTASLS